MNLIKTSPHPVHFWGEVAPCDHLVQIYDGEAVFLESLEQYVASGIRAGEGIILIATKGHQDALDARLSRRGFDLLAARASGQLITVDAAETLDRFMVDGWPDDARFRETVEDLLKRAIGDGRKVRAFGEMVALLWAQGHCGATVRLEHLWHRFCAEGGFSLLCAYPKSGFTSDATESIRQICDAHSHVVEATGIVPRAVSSMRHLTKRIDSLA